jgi:hypothetical protein
MTQKMEQAPKKTIASQPTAVAAVYERRLEFGIACHPPFTPQ